MIMGSISYDFWNILIRAPCVCTKSPQSCLTLCDPMDCSLPGSSVHRIHQAQECWSGLPCPLPGDLPDPGIEPMSLTSPALAGEFFAISTTWILWDIHYFSPIYRFLVDGQMPESRSSSQGFNLKRWTVSVMICSLWLIVRDYILM